jgi:hypothetical protein
MAAQPASGKHAAAEQPPTDGSARPLRQGGKYINAASARPRTRMAASGSHLMMSACPSIFCGHGGGHGAWGGRGFDGAQPGVCPAAADVGQPLPQRAACLCRVEGPRPTPQA